MTDWLGVEGMDGYRMEWKLGIYIRHWIQIFRLLDTYRIYKGNTCRTFSFSCHNWLFELCRFITPRHGDFVSLVHFFLFSYCLNTILEGKKRKYLLVGKGEIKSAQSWNVKSQSWPKKQTTPGAATTVATGTFLIC